MKKYVKYVNLMEMYCAKSSLSGTPVNFTVVEDQRECYTSV